MKTNTMTVASAVFTLALASVSGAGAQHAQHAHGAKPQSTAMNMTMMMREPHHVLAAAYMQNMATFAKALRDQTARSSTVDVEFSRSAVAEMRLSYDRMKEHHDEHMQAMSPEMHAKMSGMMQKMEMHQTELSTSLTALEQEVNAATPNAKKLSALAAGVSTHLTAMSTMHGGGTSSGMKMKM